MSKLILRLIVNLRGVGFQPILEIFRIRHDKRYLWAETDNTNTYLSPQSALLTTILELPSYRRTKNSEKLILTRRLQEIFYIFQNYKKEII